METFFAILSVIFASGVFMLYFKFIIEYDSEEAVRKRKAKYMRNYYNKRKQ